MFSCFVFQQAAKEPTFLPLFGFMLMVPLFIILPPSLGPEPMLFRPCIGGPPLIIIGPPRIGGIPLIIPRIGPGGPPRLVQKISIIRMRAYNYVFYEQNIVV